MDQSNNNYFFQDESELSWDYLRNLCLMHNIPFQKVKKPGMQATLDEINRYIAQRNNGSNGPTSFSGE